ncbi:cell division protein ZipA [Thermochromatium tepidum]|uniref:Cell division protein ZipA n=1 Tax=Thermochromatium tepidum ATCC 43061 TaxID=316276 RepID=A0A6I6E9C8_THETI|nr:cell division protein ZipA [Thermochromatium tepidum]QGU31549.1 cell division protein ZipA [Thermochromatium tepidum ATCC 43061]
MDASTIRLILIVVGAILIVALYLWERHRERQGVYQDDHEDDGLFDERGAHGPHGIHQRRRAPILDQYDDEEWPDDEDSATKPSRPVKSWSRSRADKEPEHESRPEDARTPMSEDVADSRSVKTSRKPAPPPPPKSPKRREISVPDPLLIQLTVSARRYPFKGPDILEVAASCGLYPGEMDIFHCFDEFEDEIRVYFSMANMVKPGRFPFDDMDGFSTPGLVLFAQLEGDPEDMTILDEMLATARKLALSLNGDVLDETRRPLTVKKEEEMRQAVLDNERRWKRTPRL